ncbi:family 78 glycoside hydrolase catalytic domain [Paenibacillus sp. FSL K6-1096]|uniref:family 78 glycoside hydrolase catalytic domain n=1 Tax=Paenibacillus sp. FSL K6-1096 TaxID=2921460 RepID=UPI0030EB7F52
MDSRNGSTITNAWQASWITRPIENHYAWDGYSVSVLIQLERGRAALLFGYQSEERHYTCVLDAGTGTVSLFTVEDGREQALGTAEAPGLIRPEQADSGSNSEVLFELLQREETVIVRINGQQTMAVPSAPFAGTVGFRTEAGSSAVFRELRVFDSIGRALYVNRFYDPDTIHFTAGEIDRSGNGLRLAENVTSLCRSPVPVDSPLFRRAFGLSAGIRKAVIRVYALGWVELTVNGHKPDRRVLAPANTPYGRRLLYDTYEVTGLLQSGENVIGLWLGNGYNHNYSRWGWKWKRDKAVILELAAELEDGSSVIVGTDESWTCTDSPILVNDIYDGETLDGRLIPAGWNLAGYTGGESWRAARLAEPPEGELLPNPQPPVLPFEPLVPVRVLRPRAGTLVYDFGQNIAGWVRISVQGPSGHRITMKYSELIDERGNIDPWTNRNARAADVYILRGGQLPADSAEHQAEMYEPRFTYHGFRYVEITGGIEPDSITAVPIHADVTEAGTFTSSDPLLNRIQSNIRWSYLNNLVSIPTDCCQRDERTPCLMDSAVVEEAGIHNFDMQAYYRKWLGDIKDSESNPDWSGDKVSLPWHLYWYYGDVGVLEDSYPAMKSYVEHLAAKWPEGLVEEGFGDWCPPNEDGWEAYFHEVGLVNTALYYRLAVIVSETAGVLGLEEDRSRYEALGQSVAEAFHARFHQGAGVYGSGSQTAQIMPLAYGLVPAGLVDAAARRLAEAIAEQGGRLGTGIYGTRYLMDVLADHGYIDLALTILRGTEYPGFGYQIAQGATTLWEQWSPKGAMHSHDHAMFGGIGASFYTRLAGIRPLAPGYERILIHPHIPEGLDSAAAEIRSVRGLIRSEWSRTAGELVLTVVIPPDTTAVIMLPSDRQQTGARVRHEAGPGRHQFTAY